MKCANCGKEINTAVAFCPFCGEQLTGFGMQDDYSRGFGNRDDENMTYIGSFDDPVVDGTEEGHTYMDSSGQNDRNPETEDYTYLDSSRYRQEKMKVSDPDRTYLDSRGMPMSGEQNTSSGSPDSGGNHDRGGYVLSPGGYDRMSPDSGFSGNRRENVRETRGAGSRGLVIVLIAVLLLAAAGAAYFFFSHRTPQLDTLTYDELVTEYELSDDDVDDVKKAYYDNVRFEFDNVSKGTSGYKATAVIYTPDMEEIYARTTAADEIADRLRRLSEEDLDHNQKTVLIDEDSEGLSHHSAETLHNLVNDKYMTVEEYVNQTGKSGNTGTAVSDSSAGTGQHALSSGSAGSSSAGQNADAESGSVQQSEEPAASSTGSDIRITGVSATSTLYEKGYDHSPSNVLDGRLSTAWVEGASGQGSGERLTLTLNGTHTISTMVINAGYQKSARLYGRNSRPKTMTLFFSDGSNESVALADTNGAQTVTLVRPVPTDTVTIQIDSVYAGSVYQDTCISEIRFE